MRHLLAGCLVFAGVCLIGSSTVAVVDWAACRASNGGAACRPSKADAMAALTGAANVALGVAFQRREEDQ